MANAFTPQLYRIFLWQIIRHTLRHKTLALLNILSMALGVAVYLAIQIANQSANVSFAAGVYLVAGKAHLEARGSLADTHFPKLRAQPNIAAATPLVEGLVTLPDYPGEYLHVLGIDVFSNNPFRTFELGDFALDPWLSTPDSIAIPETLAQRLDLRVGQRIRVLVNGESRHLTIISTWQPESTATAASDRFAAMDIGWAQELLQKGSTLSGIQFLLKEPSRAQETADELQKLLPADASVAAPRQRSMQLEKMVGAFQLNLTALSMVSLLVGMFLIYNTVTASVARSRYEIGILRALGASRNEVRTLFLGEAVLFGVVGIVLGIFLGIALSTALIGAVSQTISSLYVLASVRSIAVQPFQIITATSLGLVSVVIAGWLPAHRAATISPLEALAKAAPLSSVRRLSGGWVIAGVSVLGLAFFASFAALVLKVGWLGFVSAFLTVLGFASLAPWWTSALASAVLKLLPPGSFILLRLGVQGVLRSLHRNAVTVAALAAAVAMMISLTVMIFSFRQSVSEWILRTVSADLFLAPASNEVIGLNATIPQSVIDYVRRYPSIAGVDTFREISVRLAEVNSMPFSSANVALAITDGNYRGNVPFKGGDERELMAKIASGEAVAVTESFAQKYLPSSAPSRPATVTLATPSGLRTFPIAGVYRDYTRDAGVILMGTAAYRASWGDAGVNSLAVYLAPGADAIKFAEDFRQEFSREGEFAVYFNAELRNRILTIFDQTFAVTSLLRVIAVIVASLGIFLSVTTAVVERGREIGIFKAMGASAAQVRALFFSESAFIAIASSTLGIGCGLALSFILTWVVNRVFFGWTIDLQFPWLAILSTPLWMIPAALVATALPAWRASKEPVAAAVRND